LITLVPFSIFLASFYPQQLILPADSMTKDWRNYMKARAISNIYEFYNAVSVQEIKSQTFEEELLKINKIRYGLGVVYFLGVSFLLTTLFL
jgi:hypothetical protein